MEDGNKGNDPGQGSWLTIQVKEVSRQQEIIKVTPGARHCTQSCKVTLIFSPYNQPRGEVLFIIPVIQMRKLRPRYINHLAQGHRTNTHWTRAVRSGTETAQRGDAGRPLRTGTWGSFQDE